MKKSKNLVPREVKVELLLISMIFIITLFSINLVNAWTSNVLLNSTNSSFTSENISIIGGDTTNVRYIQIPSNVTYLTGAYLNLTGYSINITGLFYQESANVTNQTGIDGGYNLNYTGNYTPSGVGWTTGVNNVSATYDGNWNSYSYGSGSNMNVYYIKPTYYNNTNDSIIYRIKDWSGEYNISLPLNCTNYSNYINVGYTSDSTPQTYFYCFDRLGNINILKRDVGGVNIYEEGIYWNTTMKSYLTNPDLDSDNGLLWFQNGIWNTSNYTGNVANILNPILNNYPNLSGYYYFPLIFYADTSGTFGYKNLFFSNQYDVRNNYTSNFSDYVTNSKTFLVNVSFDTNLYSLATASLCSNFTNNTIICIDMNGQPYQNGEVFTKTIDLPNQSGVYNFYYEVNLVQTDGSTTFTDLPCADGMFLCTANLTDINIYPCNTSNPVSLYGALNFTAWNQDTLAKVNPFNISSTLKYFVGNGTTSKVISLSNYSNEFDLCQDYGQTTLTTPYKITGVVQYQNPNYQTGIDYFNRYNLPIAAPIPKPINLYFMNSSLSTSFIILVQDTNQNPLTNYFVYIYRYYPATDTSLLVQSLQTDAAGQGIGFFETETVLYSFIITDNFGNVVLSTQKRNIIPQTTPYEIIFTVGSPTPSPYTYFNNLSQMTYTLAWNQGSKKVSYVYSDSNSSFQNAYLTVSYQNYSGGSPVVCNISSLNTPASLICDLSSNLSGSYIAQAYTIRNGVSYLVNTINFDISGFNAGMLGLLGGFCIILICSFAFAWNEVAGIVMIDVAVIANQLLGLINFGIIGVSAILGISVLILIFLERG